MRKNAKKSNASKKLSKMFLIASVIFLYSSCSSNKNISKTSNTLSENQVIFYGVYHLNKKTEFFQKDTNFAPDFQSFKNEYFVSTPVECGSTYRIFYVKGKERKKGLLTPTYITDWNAYFSMQTTDFDIQIPQTPGLYYIGSFDGLKSYAEGKPVRFQKADSAQEELKCLKKAASVPFTGEQNGVLSLKKGLRC